MKLTGWIASIVLASLLTYAVFGGQDTVTEYITLPSQTIYDTTTVVKLDSITRVVFRDRDVYTTDTLTLRDTVWLTRPDTLTTLPPRWRLTALTVGQSVHEPTYVAGDLLQYDGALTRIQSVEQFPVTLGPVTDIRTDSLGIHLNFGSWPEPPKTCSLWCRGQFLLGGLAAGVILGSL